MNNTINLYFIKSPYNTEIQEMVVNEIKQSSGILYDIDVIKQKPIIMIRKVPLQKTCILCFDNIKQIERFKINSKKLGRTRIKNFIKHLHHPYEF